MNAKSPHNCPQEYDFALVVAGVHELTDAVTDALYVAGCDDATVSMQYGRLYLEFSRTSGSKQDAIISAIGDVSRAAIGAEVLRVDTCDLVTQAEIARRVERTRQTISQYINGTRGAGDFPPPECYIIDHKPLWSWCSVSQWLSANDMLRSEASWEAEVVATINDTLETNRRRKRLPKLVDDVERELSGLGSA